MPTSVNNNGTALTSVSVNVMGGQGTLPSSRQAMAATTSIFFYEGASSIAQEHTAVIVLQLHHVGGMQSTTRVEGLVQGGLSPYLPLLYLTVLQLT